MEDETKPIPASVSVSVRIPENINQELKMIADTRYIPLSTLLRIWILERYEEEKKKLEV